MGDRLGSFRGVCIERDDYLRQQAAMYRQLAEKTEHAVVKRDLVPLDKEQGSRPVACRAVFDARTAMSTLRPIATAERIFLRSSLSAISGCEQTQQYDHSKISSARPDSGSGMVMPSTRAVFKL